MKMQFLMSRLKSLSNLNSTHREIIRSGIWLAAFLFFGKVIGAVKEIFVAYRFGVSGVVDAYQFALTAINWIPGMIISALTVVLVPLLIRLKDQDSHDKKLFLKEVTGVVIFIGFFISIIIIVFTPLLLSLIGANLSVDTYSQTVNFMRELAFTTIFVLIFGLYSAQFMASGSYANTILESIPALIILIFLLFFMTSNDAFPLLYGTWVGYIIQFLLTFSMLSRSKSVTFSGLLPRLSFTSPNWLGVSKFLTVTILGQLVMSFSAPLDLFYAAKVGDNSIAILGYATRLSSLVTSLGTILFARAMLPVFANLVSNGEVKHLQKVSFTWSILTFFGGAFFLVLFWPLSSLLVEFLFERGAFTSNDTQVVAGLLRYLMIQIPFYFASLIMVQFFVSRGYYILISIIAVLVIIFKWMLNAVLTPHFGLNGIAIATSGMYFLSMSLFYISTLYVSNKDNYSSSVEGVK